MRMWDDKLVPVCFLLSQEKKRGARHAPHECCWTGRAGAAASPGCRGRTGVAEVAAAASRHASRAPSQRAGPWPAAAEASHTLSHRSACHG